MTIQTTPTGQCPTCGQATDGPPPLPQPPHGQITDRAQLRGMSPEQIVELKEEGGLNQLLGIDR